MCLSASYWSDLMSSHLPLCCSLKRLYVVSGVSASLLELCVHCSRYTTAALWWEFALSSLFHYHSLRWILFISVSQKYLLMWFHVISVVHLLLTVVALCHFCCRTNAHWGGFAYFQVFYCCFLVWVSVILSASFCFLGWLFVFLPVSLPLSEVALIVSTAPLLILG